MNKKCTNSSCRKTFSTLYFRGVCPYCGKKYPQINAPQHSKAYSQIMKYLKRNASPDTLLVLTGGNKPIKLPVEKLPEIKAFLAQNQKVPAVRLFMKSVGGEEYKISLIVAHRFCTALMEGKVPFVAGYLTGEKTEDNRKVIKLLE